MKRKVSPIKAVSFYVIILIVLCFTLFPLVYIFASSFKTPREIMLGGARIFPESISFNNYINAWNAANFSRYTINSIVYSVGSMVLSIFLCSMAAFVLVRRDIRFKKFIHGCYQGSMFVAGAVTLYPIFIMLVKSGLSKTLLGMILATAGMGQAFIILLIAGYMKGVPKELDESAILDGCGPFRLYAYIIMPVITPVIGVVAMISFQSAWNNYMLPMALTTASPNLRPLSVGVTALTYTGEGKSIGQWDLLIAGSCMAMIPIILVYILGNRYFVSDVMSGSVKG